MAVRTTITITHDREAIGTITNKLLKASSKPHEEATAIHNFMNALNGKDRNGKLVVQVDSGDAVKATGTITLSSFANNDTFTIGSQTFTCKTSGASGQNQFNIGGTDTLSAAAAVVVINANTAINQYILATSVGAVITLTCTIPGTIGNLVTIAISAHGSVSAAALASGVQATTYSATNTYRLGV